MPDGKVIGLSKIPRIIDMFARRLQVQERMTRQIAGFLQETLDPLGVAALCESVHTCSATREVKNANARIVTSAMPGSLKSSQATREEFMPLSSGGMRRSTGSLGTGTAGCSLVPLGKRLDHESREKTRP